MIKPRQFAIIAATRLLFANCFPSGSQSELKIHRTWWRCHWQQWSSQRLQAGTLPWPSSCILPLPQLRIPLACWKGSSASSRANKLQFINNHLRYTLHQLEYCANKHMMWKNTAKLSQALRSASKTFICKLTEVHDTELDFSIIQMGFQCDDLKASEDKCNTGSVARSGGQWKILTLQQWAWPRVSKCRLFQ